MIILGSFSLRNIFRRENLNEIKLNKNKREKTRKVRKQKNEREKDHSQGTQHKQEDKDNIIFPDTGIKV